MLRLVEENVGCFDVEIGVTRNVRRVFHLRNVRQVEGGWGGCWPIIIGHVDNLWEDVTDVAMGLMAVIYDNVTTNTATWLCLLELEIPNSDIQ